ncbi:hypothetical protein JCGZ_09792 [Jatropha curcas]|uniref:Uncharacterized protein n=1 Tax=Jatropha curcas TaxID=180498 RepID=A0A067KVK3_JATCU|nr:hypothetical protein JCGZ_09792 [Jatropha curcas]
MMEEMCPLFEEFCAIIGCDPNAPLVKHEVKIGPRNALLSSLEGWAQADADNEVGTDEEIVLAPRTGEVGESLAARDDSEDVATRRRRDN